MAMKSRVYEGAIKLLEQGNTMSKHDIAEIVFCCHRAALNALRKIRETRQDVKIVGWQQVYHQKVPVYGISSEPDVPKPAPIADIDRLRSYRVKYPEVSEREALKKRVRRQAAKLGIPATKITIHRMGA